MKLNGDIPHISPQTSINFGSTTKDPKISKTSDASSKIATLKEAAEKPPLGETHTVKQMHSDNENSEATNHTAVPILLNKNMSANANQTEDTKAQSPLSKNKTDAVNKIFDEVINSSEHVADQNSVAHLREHLETEVSKLSKENPTHSFEIHGQTFVISKGLPDNPQAIAIAKKTDFIAKGSFGEVFAVKYLDSNEENVMKLALPNETAVADVRNEAKILTYISTKGKELGLDTSNIQSAPHTAVYMNSAGVVREGYIAQRYQGDVHKLIPPQTYDDNDNPIEISNPYFSQDPDQAIDERMSVVNQMLDTTEILEKVGIYHGDIKTGNMLFKYNESDQIKAVLADFGGARTYEELKANFVASDSPPTLQMLFGTITPEFFSTKYEAQVQTELNNAEALFNEVPKDETKIAQHFDEKIKPLLLKIDSYAVAVSAYSLIVKNYDLISSPGVGLDAYHANKSFGEEFYKNELVLSMREELLTALATLEHQYAVADIDDPNEAMKALESPPMTQEKLDMAQRIIQVIEAGA